jgi:predicted porin
MKATMIAVAVLASVAAAAQAQSNVTVYGVVDVGLVKATGTTTKEAPGDNNRLGFKGVEDLGGGLSAVFQLEMRFEPDTGTVEGGARPLFQGQSRVGLAGPFGLIRFGRGLTPMQEAGGAFEPWNAVRSRGTTTTPGILQAGFNTDPLAGGPATNATNRISNAVFYTSPVIGGLQGNLSVASKEDGFDTTRHAVAVPVSAAGTYSAGALGAMVAYERNALADKFWQLAGSYLAGPAKVMASYGETKLAVDNSKIKGQLIGARLTAGPGTVLLSLGQKKPDRIAPTHQAALGYEYNLSKRSYLYTDAKNTRQDGTPTINTFDVGIHHTF